MIIPQIDIVKTAGAVFILLCCAYTIYSFITMLVVQRKCYEKNNKQKPDKVDSRKVSSNNKEK